MPSLLGHMVVGATLAFSSSRKPWPVRFWLLMLLSTVIADVDLFLGHQAATHSMLAAFAWAILTSFLFLKNLKWLSKRWWTAFWSVYMAAMSHLLLVALTKGESGVTVFWPWSSERYFFAWQPLERYQPQTEILWIAVPCVLVLLFSRRAR